MTLRIIALVLLAFWGTLVLIGKGGFVHLLLLNGLGVLSVEIMTIVRSRMTVED